MSRKVDRACMAMMGLVVAAGVAAHAMMPTPKTEIITYQKEVAMGDTVWSIVSEIATDDEDKVRLVDQVLKDNHIKHPDYLTPGTLLIINVQQARK